MNNQIKMLLPTPTKKKRIVVFNDIEEIENYINEKTGFTPYIEKMNIQLFIDNIFLGTLKESFKVNWDSKYYHMNIQLSEDFISIYDNSELWDVTPENPYPSPESTFLSEYSILKHKECKNLIVTVFDFSKSGDEYYFDFIDDSISDNVKQINEFVWNKYEDNMY